MEFRYESEMAEPVRKWLEGQQLIARQEFQLPWGICDLIGISLCPKNVKVRLEQGQKSQVGSLFRAELLLQIPDVNARKGITLKNLEKRYSHFGALKIERELEILQRRKFICKNRRGSFQKFNGWLPLHDRIIAVELKLSRVSEALDQAARNLQLANESYVGLPKSIAMRIAKSDRAVQFQRNGIGILGIDSDGCELVLASSAKKKFQDNVLQMHCADRIWCDWTKDTSS